MEPLENNFVTNQPAGDRSCYETLLANSHTLDYSQILVCDEGMEIMDNEDILDDQDLYEDIFKDYDKPSPVTEMDPVSVNCGFEDQEMLLQYIGNLFELGTDDLLNYPAESKDTWDAAVGKNSECYLESTPGSSNVLEVSSNTKRGPNETIAGKDMTNRKPAESTEPLVSGQTQTASAIDISVKAENLGFEEIYESAPQTAHPSLDERDSSARSKLTYNCVRTQNTPDIKRAEAIHFTNFSREELDVGPGVQKQSLVVPQIEDAWQSGQRESSQRPGADRSICLDRQHLSSQWDAATPHHQAVSDADASDKPCDASHLGHDNPADHASHSSDRWADGGSQPDSHTYMTLHYKHHDTAELSHTLDQTDQPDTGFDNKLSDNLGYSNKHPGALQHNLNAADRRNLTDTPVSSPGEVQRIQPAIQRSVVEDEVYDNNFNNSEPLEWLGCPCALQLMNGMSKVFEMVSQPTLLTVPLVDFIKYFCYVGTEDEHHQQHQNRKQHQHCRQQHPQPRQPVRQNQQPRPSHFPYRQLTWPSVSPVSSRLHTCTIFLSNKRLGFHFPHHKSPFFQRFCTT